MWAGERPARCPNHFFAVNEVSAVPWWWCDLFWRHEVACGVRWSKVVGCEVTWGVLLWLVVTWHVMSRHVIWCDVIDCVASCRVDAMRCHGDELLSVVPCNELKMPLVVRSHCAVRSGSVTMWWPKVLLCTTKYYSSTAPATQNESRDWSASHVKRHFQRAEQVKSPFKLAKYCAEILSSRFRREIPELFP